MVTSFTAIGALIFTALSLNATRDQVAVAQQGQYTDRYNRAIEQLSRQGADQLQIRLGGIYALERLARDSPRDQPTIIEVLTTFIRTSTPPLGSTGCATATPALSADVVAAMTVLGRRDRNADGDAPPQLEALCLPGADLSRSVLAGLNLEVGNFSGANLSEANVEFSNLRYARLDGADLNYAYFTGANLGHADLTNASFFGAYLRGATLLIADLRDADLTGADLTAADLRSAALDGAILRGADLGGADLEDADLGGAALDGADLTGADLRGADLRDTYHIRTRVADVVIDERTQGEWW